MFWLQQFGIGLWLFVMVLWCMFMGATTFDDALFGDRWEQIDATVVVSQVRRDEHSQGGRKYGWDLPIFEVNYEAWGRTWECEVEPELKGDFVIGKSQAQEVLDKYPVGSTVPIVIHPIMPWRADFESHNNNDDSIGLSVLCVLMVGLFAGAWNTTSSALKQLSWACPSDVAIPGHEKSFWKALGTAFRLLNSRNFDTSDPALPRAGYVLAYRLWRGEIGPGTKADNLGGKGLSRPVMILLLVLLFVFTAIPCWAFASLILINYFCYWGKRDDVSMEVSRYPVKPGDEVVFMSPDIQALATQKEDICLLLSAHPIKSPVDLFSHCHEIASGCWSGGNLLLGKFRISELDTSQFKSVYWYLTVVTRNDVVGCAPYKIVEPAHPSSHIIRIEPGTSNTTVVAG